MSAWLADQAESKARSSPIWAQHSAFSYTGGSEHGTLQIVCEGYLPRKLALSMDGNTDTDNLPSHESLWSVDLQLVYTCMS